MRILVTGGAGFVGSHVAEAYKAAGHEVVVVDDYSTGENRLSSGLYLHRNINDSKEMYDVFVDFRPEVVNHHAANPSIPRSVEAPGLDAEINIQGTLSMLWWANEFEVQQFILASTSEVYGPSQAAEAATLFPQSPYAIGKMAAEEYTRWFGRQYGITTTIFRYANIYGPRQTPDQGAVIPKFIHNLTHGIPVTLNGGGVATRDFVYVEDVATANLLALGKDGTFNIGSGKLVSIRELLGLIEDELGVSGETRLGTRPTDFGASALDITKAHDILGWDPQTTLEEGLHRTVAAQRSREEVAV